MVDLQLRDSSRESLFSHPRRRRVQLPSGSSCQTFSLFMLPKTLGAPSLAEMLAAQWKLKVRWSDMMRQCERLLGEYCLGKTGWRIGELMGENRAYPLWLYPRIHVHSRDPTGSLRTSSDWTISKPHGHPSAISQFRGYRIIIKPLSVSAHLQYIIPGLISIE